MITPKQFKATVAAITTLYTVTANQKGILKALTVANPSATPCTFTLVVFGVTIFTTRTLGPYETKQCTEVQNMIGLPGDTITITPTASVGVLGSAVETPNT